MSQNLYLRDGVYYARFIVNGKRYRVSTRTGDRRQAAAVMRQLRHRATLDHAKGFDAEARAVPLAQRQEGFLAHLEAEGRGAAYIAGVRPVLEGALKFMPKPDDWTPMRVKAYLLRRPGLATTTLERNRAILSSFCTYLGGLGVLPLNPAGRWHIGKLRGERSKGGRCLTIEEARALLATAPPERAVWYRLALETGMRRGEIEAMTPDMLQDAPPAVRLPREVTKNRDEATLPVTRETLAAVRAALVAGERPPIRMVVRHDFGVAGVDLSQDKGRVGLHSLRHTFNLAMAQAGVPASLRKSAMRHQSERLTETTYLNDELVDRTAAASKAWTLLVGGSSDA